MTSHFSKPIFLVLVLVFAALFSQAQEVFLPVTTSSDEAKEYYLKAMQGQLDAKIPVFMENIDKAIEADPNFFMAYYQKAMANIAFLGDIESAKVTISKALESKGDWNKAEQILVKAFYSLKEDTQADISAQLAEVAVLYPNVGEALGTNAFYNMARGNKEAALKYARQFVILMPNVGAGYNMLGYVEMDNGNMEKSEKAFKKYLEMEPNNANPYDSMGDFLTVAKRYEEAIEHYKKAYQIDKTFTISLEKAKKAEEEMKKQ